MNYLLRVFVFVSVFVCSARAQLITIDKAHLPTKPPLTKPNRYKVKTQARSRESLSTMSAMVAGPIPVDQPVVVLGQGYNALTGDILPEVCVDKTREDVSFGHVGSAKDVEYIDVTSNMATHQSSTGESAGFNVTYKLISVGADVGATSTSYFNSIDQFARIYKRLITSGQVRISGDWSQDGWTAIHGTLANFSRICGTHYVSAVYYGSYVDRTIRFKLHDDQYSSASRGSFNIGVANLFKVGASSASSQTSIDSASSINSFGNADGVVVPPPVIDPHDVSGVVGLANFARRDYPAAIASRPLEQGDLLMIEITPYYQLGSYGTNTLPQWPDEIRTAIEDRMPLYELFLTQISDLNFALSLQPTQLTSAYAETTATLGTKLQLANSYRDGFRAAAKACVDLLNAGVADQAGAA
jgi:hypothetical protein